MRKVDLAISVAAGGERIAATAFLPDDGPKTGAVIFASPGGGYGRGYYDMRFLGHEGYSQAEHHTQRGHVVVAYDHLGVGESSAQRLASMTIEEIADANCEAVAEIIRRLRKGELSEFLDAMPRLTAIGIGQSMGGGVTIIMQARRRVFDAIGVLGYSAIHTVLPQKTKADRDRGTANYRFSRETAAETLSVEASSAGVADFIYPFHWEDVPKDILDADMAGGYPIRHTAPAFGSLTIPNCVVAMMSPGYVKDEAAMIEAPVFLGFGERDVSPDPWDEPSAFPQSRDISLFVVERMAHMHNFASSRMKLWRRLSDWATLVAREA